jgi:hypothetical protein
MHGHDVDRFNRWAGTYDRSASASRSRALVYFAPRWRRRWPGSRLRAAENVVRKGGRDALPRAERQDASRYAT